jgi:ankyrin repeat protein
MKKNLLLLAAFFTLIHGTMNIYAMQPNRPDYSWLYSKPAVVVGSIVGTIGCYFGVQQVRKYIARKEREQKKALTESINLALRIGALAPHATVAGRTNFHQAAQEGNATYVNAAITAGVPIDYVDNNGNTALTLAASAGKAHLIAPLLAARAHVNLQSNTGITALYGASCNGHTNIVQQLLQVGANVNLPTNAGDTALIAASEKGHTLVVELLCKSRADINSANNGKITALMYAAQGGHTSVVEKLIDYKADIHAKNNHGQSAINFALKHSHTASTLVKLGAQLSDLGRYGHDLEQFFNKNTSDLERSARLKTANSDDLEDTGEFIDSASDETLSIKTMSQTQLHIPDGIIQRADEAKEEYDKKLHPDL